MDIDEIEAKSIAAYKQYLLDSVVDNPLILEGQTDYWRSDYDVVKAAVSINGNALQYATSILKSNKEIVILAITTSFTSLQYSSNELKDDKEIVLLAVNIHGNALRYCSDRLKNDKDIVIASIRNNPYSLQYANERLVYDTDVYSIYQQELLNRLKINFTTTLNTIIHGNFDAYHTISYHGILDNDDEDINSLQNPLKYIQHYNLRIYISSNNDVDKERAILFDEILPEIKTIASDYGIDVIMIDGYANVNDNILNHTTWIDSKHEINRCRHLSSGLFFLSLQSDKYGSRYLPKYIPMDVYDERYESFPLKQCQRCIKKSKEKKQRLECKRCSKADIQVLADQWYTLDKNNIPPRYVLRNINDSNDSNYHDEVLPKLREAFQGIVFADDDYNDEEPEELDTIFHHIKDLMKRRVLNDLSFSEEVEKVLNRIDKIDPLQNELTIHEFLKPKVLKSLTFIITSDKVIMGSKLKKRVKSLIETIEKMLIEPHDEGNDVIINRSIHEYESKVAMANDIDISRCQWISRVFSYPLSNNTTKKEKKDNLDFLLNSSSVSNMKNNDDNVIITNKYKEYNDNDDASLKLKLDNFKAHMLSSFRYESNMIKIKVPIEAYINHDSYINGKEYLTEWKEKVSRLLRKELDHVIFKKLQWYHDCFGLNTNGDDMDEILHHCKLAYIHSHDFVGRTDLIKEIMASVESKDDKLSEDIDILTNTNIGEDRHSLQCITLCLIGIPGVGKTSLISKIASTCFQKTSNVPVIIRYCGTSSGSLSGLDLIKSINIQLRLTYNLPLQPLSNDYDKAVLSFQSLLSQYGVILLIDSLDMLTNTNQEVSHLSFLRGTKLHSESRIIISLTSVTSPVVKDTPTNSNATINATINNDTTTSSTIAEADGTVNSVKFTENDIPSKPVTNNNTSHLSTEKNDDKSVDIIESYKETDKEYCHLLLKRSGIKQLYVANFNDYEAGASDSIQILHFLLDKKGRKLTETQWDYVIQQSALEPIPLYLRLILPIIEKWDSFHTALNLTATVKDLVTEIIQNLEAIYGLQLVRAMLGYISFSLQGLTLTHLQDLLSLNDDVTDSFFKNSNTNKLQIPINVILRIKNTLEEHCLLTEKKEGKIYWSHIEIKKIAYDRYSANKQEEITYRSLMGIYFGNLVDPSLQKERCISAQPVVVGNIPVWFNGTILNRSRSVEAVYQMLEGESFLIFKAYSEICRPDVICASIKCGEGFNLISYFMRLKTMLQTCSAKLMFKYKYMMTDSTIDYNTMLLYVDHYLAWLQKDITTLMVDPSTQMITTVTTNQPLVSKARLEVEKFIKSTSVSFFEINASSNFWIRGKSCGGKSAFDVPRLIIRGHTSGIRCITSSPDGTRIASSGGSEFGSIDNSVRVWDAATGDLILQMSGHFDAVNSIAFTSDGSRLLSGSNDKTIRLFDTTTGVEIVMKELPNIVTGVAWYHDNKHLIISCGNSIMILVIESLFETIEIKIDIKEDLVTLVGSLVDITYQDGHPFKAKAYQKAKETIMMIGGPIYNVADLQGKEHIDDDLMAKFNAYVNGEIDINLNDIDNVDNVDNESIGESIASSVIDSITGNEVMNDGNTEPASVVNKTVKYSVIEKFEINLIKQFTGHSGMITSLVYRQDGDRILTSSNDNTIILWNYVTGMLMTLKGHTNCVNDAVFSNDGSLILSGANDRSIRLWDTVKGTEIIKFEGHTDIVLTVAFSSDKQFVFSGSADNSIRKWDPSNGKELMKWDGHTGAVSRILIREDISAIISSSADCSVIIWELDNKSSEKSKRHLSSVTALTLSPDGKQIVSGSRDTYIITWLVETGEALKVLEGHTDDVTTLSFNTDGSILASGSGGNDNSIRLWDPIVGDWLLVLKGHTDDIVSLHFSPDGARIVSRSKDRTLRLFDSATGDGLELVGHTDWITSIAYTPDSSRLASGSFDKTIRVWNSISGDVVTVIEGSISPVLSLAFNLHGSQIVSGSGQGLENTIRVWQAFTGVELKKLRGHECDVTNVSFTNDGSRIVSVSDDDKCIKIWDAVTGADLTTVAIKTLAVSESYKFERNYSSAYIARFDKTLYGSRIISTITDKTIGVYDSVLCSKILEFEGTSEVTLVMLHNNGKLIITGGKDGTLSIWDITVY